MKCSKCGNDFEVKLGTKAVCRGCSILTSMTTIFTVKCNNCGAVFQVPVSSKSMMSVKKDN